MLLTYFLLFLCVTISFQKPGKYLIEVEGGDFYKGEYEDAEDEAEDLVEHGSDYSNDEWGEDYGNGPKSYAPAPPPYQPPAPGSYQPTPKPYQPTPKPYQPTPKPYQPTPKPYKPAPTTPSCHLSEWSNWSGGKDCGPYTVTRTRTCVGSSYACNCNNAKLSGEEDRNDKPCCAWIQWSEWSNHKKTCGKETITRSRDCLCDGVSSNKEKCGGGAKIDNKDVIHNPCTTKPPSTPKPYQPPPKPYQPPPKTYAQPTPPPYQPPPPKTYNQGPKTYGKKKKHRKH